MAAIGNYDTYHHNTARVWTAATLGAGADHWTERPYLRVDGLNLVAAPDIDQCQMSYWTGRFATREADEFGNEIITAPQWFNALDLNRQFVKVEILDRNNIDPDTGERAILFTWYGVVEVDDRSESQLASEPLGSENRTGRQTLAAFGLLRLLETHVIRSSVVKGPDGVTDTQTIARGLPFNFNSRGSYLRRGNRTKLTVSGVFVHNFLPEKDDDPTLDDNFWTAGNAIDYLLEHQTPLDRFDEPVCTWVAEPKTSGKLPVDFYDITVTTDRRSVKAVLDDLIDRRRMVGYWVYGRETGNVGSEVFEAVLKLFTFTDTAIDLEDGEIPANPELESLFGGSSPVVDDLRVRRMATTEFDEIVVEGAYATSTLTLGFGENDAEIRELAEGWTIDLEDSYRTGAGNGDAEENTIVRTRDELRDVFARFRIETEWPARVAYDIDDDGTVEEYFVTVFPNLLPIPVEDDDVQHLFVSTGDPDEDEALQSPWSYHTKRFLDLMPLKDADTNEYRRPFAFFQEGSQGSPQDLWAFAENVSVMDPQRKFNCSLRLLQDRLGFHLEVNRPGGQHMIAAGHWDGADSTPEELNPGTGGLNYENMKLTGTVEWDDKVQVVKTLATPTGAKRTLVISVPDARLDFVLPGTVKDISESGTLVYSSGEVLNDDRPRLKSIAEAAAVWYGQTRQALSVRYRELQPYVTLGTLITRLWSVSEDPINTPVSGIRYDFLSGTTSIETAYADIDFAALGRTA